MILQVVPNMRSKGCAHVLQKMEENAKDNSPVHLGLCIILGMARKESAR